MFFLKSEIKFAIALTIGIFLIWGCATSGYFHIPVTYQNELIYKEWPNTILEKRFQEYWFDRFAGKISDAYQIESPYVREIVGFGKYDNYVKHTVGQRLTNIKIQQISKESDFLIAVSCTIRIQSGNQKPVDTSLIDRWVFVGTTWYHVIKDPYLLSL